MFPLRLYQGCTVGLNPIIYYTKHRQKLDMKQMDYHIHQLLSAMEEKNRINLEVSLIGIAY